MLAAEQKRLHTHRYQFNPPLLSPPSTLSILLLSLAHAPFSPDFALAYALLSDSFVAGAALPPVSAARPAQGSDDSEDDEDDFKVPAVPRGERELAHKLLALSSLLAGRKFSSFWADFAALATQGNAFEREIIAGAVGFEACLRRSIAVEVESTFRGLARPTLERFLGVSGELFLW